MVFAQFVAPSAGAGGGRLAQRDRGGDVAGPGQALPFALRALPLPLWREGLKEGHPEQVVFVAVFDRDADDLAGSEVARVAEVDFAVDFGGVGL